MLNHLQPDVTGIYDRYSYDREKRHALDAWGTRLIEILSGEEKPDNIVPIAVGGESA